MRSGRVCCVPTIGVAVAVPEPWGRQLQSFREALGDPAAAGIPTHVTLVPPTQVADLDEADEHLQAAAAGLNPFQVRLRGTGTFRPISPVVFVTVAQGIGGFEQLEKAVRRGPLAIDLDFPYHPHVTVAQGVDEALLDRAFDELAQFSCDFTVSQFHLYVHEDEAGWRPRRTFDLG